MNTEDSLDTTTDTLKIVIADPGRRSPEIGKVGYAPVGPHAPPRPTDSCAACALSGEHVARRGPFESFASASVGRDLCRESLSLPRCRDCVQVDGTSSPIARARRAREGSLRGSNYPWLLRKLERSLVKWRPTG